MLKGLQLLNSNSGHWRINISASPKTEDDVAISLDHFCGARIPQYNSKKKNGTHTYPFTGKERYWWREIKKKKKSEDEGRGRLVY